MTATTERPQTFASRQGISVHVSVLRHVLENVRSTSPVASDSLEAWLLGVANHRGARVVIGPIPLNVEGYPGRDEVDDEQVVIGLLMPGLRDAPQMLRPAAQLISRGHLDVERLIRLAIQERADRTLAELARSALHVDPRHPTWRRIAEALGDRRPYRESVLHWSRLASPVMRGGKVNAETWTLVS